MTLHHLRRDSADSIFWRTINRVCKASYVTFSVCVPLSETTNRTVCGEHHKIEQFKNGTWKKSEKPVSITLCGNNEKCGYGSYSYEVFHNVSGSVIYTNISLLSGGGCANTSWCSDLCTGMQQSLTSGAAKVRRKACNMTCCEGDFCNIKNAPGI